MARGHYPELDSKGRVKPLKYDCIVRLRRRLRIGLATYMPNRFGVRIPAGVVLPKDALIMGEAPVEPAFTSQHAREEIQAPEGPILPNRGDGVNNTETAPANNKNLAPVEQANLTPPPVEPVNLNPPESPAPLNTDDPLGIM